MNENKIIECVPNFSEGRDLSVIRKITDEIEKVEGVTLLDVDPGKATNRTVVTFVGHPEAAIEAAFQAIKKAMEVIDMTKHSGEHPRMGATDVCPLIPISGVSMEEAVEYANKLGKRVGEELGLPNFMYESAAKEEKRKNLATIRAGEYEGMEKKLLLPEWKPDYGPAKFLPQSGATVIGARDFLVAYNVNLNTKSVRRANSVAFDVRENGRVKREGNPITGKIVEENGVPVRVPGACKSVKAIGWFIEEYDLAQISMNLTDIKETPLHIAFEECRKSANRRGLRVTGSELVGLMPLKVLTDAGKYFLKMQGRSTGVSEEEMIHIAVKSLGLDDLAEFDPRKKIIEYVMKDKTDSLISMNLRQFANETASESAAPGGGSISAYVGSLGIALGTMVSNLSANKRGWDGKIPYYAGIGEQGQALKDRLLELVDKDTDAFNQIMNAIKMPKSNDAEKAARSAALVAATKNAIEIPLLVMKTSHESYALLREMANNGNPASASDVGVGALCTHTAIEGAFLNVKINLPGISDQAYVEDIMGQAQKISDSSVTEKDEILSLVESKL